MPKSTQLPLDLSYRPLFNPADFLPAPCNQEAVDWILRYPNWPAHALMVYGPAGCGKTHLSYLFCTARIEAAALTGDDFGALETDRLVVERVDALKDERALFHLFNWAREKNIGLLFTARKIPSFQLPDLASRMALVPKAEILPPDDALMYAVLSKAFSERGILVEPAVLEYAIRQMDRSFDALRALIDDADTLSLAQNRRITIPIIKDVLKTQKSAQDSL